MGKTTTQDSIELVGLAWFPYHVSADAYYKVYGFTSKDVREKIAAGEIHIGTPPDELLTCNGDRFVIVDEKPGKRWYIINGEDNSG